MGSIAAIPYDARRGRAKGRAVDTGRAVGMLAAPELVTTGSAGGVQRFVFAASGIQLRWRSCLRPKSVLSRPGPASYILGGKHMAHSYRYASKDPSWL